MSFSLRPAPRIWLVTGASSGFGQAFVDEILARGDVAVGTFRKPEQVAAFNERAGDGGLGMLVDVTDQAQVAAGVEAALARFGRIDVLVNNAGYGFLGAVEEASEAELRAVLETNFFGALAVTRAVLPAMRAQRSGHILQISSAAGIRCGIPRLGYYAASKFALEGLSESLALELAPLGVKVTIVEPGPFRTSAMTASRHAEHAIADYATPPRSAAGVPWGDPRKGVRLMMAAVDAPTATLRLPLDGTAVESLRAKARSLLADADAWETEAHATRLVPS
jgi:NAD(P)-dependent dehydrogenase (short-subunit alcohol dehydrogenase family)